MARLRNLINRKLQHGSIKAFEDQCYKNYDLDRLIGYIQDPQDGDDWVAIVRRHLLATTFPPLGRHPFDIYVVAYVAHGGFGGKAGKSGVTKALVDAKLAGTPNAAQAVWNQGCRDGQDLEVLNADGTIADSSFFSVWIQATASGTGLDHDPEAETVGELNKTV